MEGGNECESILLQFLGVFGSESGVTECGVKNIDECRALRSVGYFSSLLSSVTFHHYEKEFSSVLLTL